MRPSNLHYVVWSLYAIFSGVALFASPVIFSRYIVAPSVFSFEAGDSVSTMELQKLPHGGDIIAVANTALMREQSEIYTARVLANPSFAVPQTGSAVFADLAEMMIRVYKDGVLTAEYPIVSKGKPGSLWETPTGTYAIKTKEENHLSTIGDVWMPYSMQFFANFFIHGWPHYADGSPVPEGFSGGCIRLSTEDAQKVFSEVTIGMPVFVTNGAEPPLLVLTGESEQGQLGYRGIKSFVPPPAISGKAAIVGDLENGFLFFEKNSQELRSIASLSKLMTALISVEAVNQFRRTTVTAEDVDVYGDAGGLKEGDEMEVGELLWPLLLSSSNDAAHAIARQIGIHQFMRLMNEKAASLGLAQTLFKDPSGLDPENKSSTLDLFRLTQHLWSNKRSILEMTEKRSHKTWRNIHPFVSKSAFAGGKTGYIPEAGRTIVSVFSLPFGEFNERPVAVVVLGSENLQADVERLRLWVKNNFVYDLRSPLQSQRVEYAARDLSDSSSSLSLLFTGDIMLDRDVRSMIEKQGNGDVAFPFEYVKAALLGADITFGNLEGPASDKGSHAGSIYSFRMDPSTPEVLKRIGFDMVSLANNHMGDWGREALEDTMRRLHRAQMAYTGAGWNSAEAVKPTVIEVPGIRVGYIAFSDVGPAWLKAGEALSGLVTLPPGYAGISFVEKAVMQANENVDILIVSFHFGEEYEEAPNARQIELSRTAIDAGARVVVGHHPHVVQSIEEYGNGVIAYSLGNFVFDQNFSAATMEGLMLKVEFDNDKIAAVIPIPVRLNEYYQPEIE